MSTKFTPGPWSINNSDKLLRTWVYAVKSPDNGGDIICMPPGMPTSLDNWKHNRCLIVAAPDMFEVIKELYDWAQSNQVFGPIYPKLEAAYLKATGQPIAPIENQ
jgi:hypothetical protein